MDTLTHDTLAHLATSGDAPTVTLVGPIRRPDERARATLEWKHLVADARHALDEAGVAAAIVEQLVLPIERVLYEQWPSHEAGIAFVSSPAGTEVFSLPGDVEPFWAVGDRPAFSVLCGIAEEAVGYVLALDLHHTAFYELRGGRLDPVLVPSLPATLETIVRTDERGQRLTTHGGAHVGRGIVGIVHGEVDAGKERDHDLDRFCRAVDDALTQVVGDDDTRPIIVAGVADLVAHLRAVAHRSARYAVEVDGSPAHVGPTDLAHRARAVVAARRDDVAADALAVFRARVGLGLASAELGDIAAAARDGRVDRLLLPDAFGPSDREAAAALDAVAADVLAARGTVFVAPAGTIERPSAIYRW